MEQFVSSIVSNPGHVKEAKLELSHVADDWLVGLGELVLLCEDGHTPTRQIVQRLRCLLEHAPASVARMLRTPEVDLEFDELVSVGANESAAILLAGQSIGYMLSRAPNGHAVASAWIPEIVTEQTVKSREPASALCGAIALVCARGFGSISRTRAMAH